MTIFPFKNPLKKIQDDLKATPEKIIPTNVSFEVGSTAVSASSFHKIKILNKYHSMETTDVRVKMRNRTPTYEDMALILFAIKKMGKTDVGEPIIFTYENNAEVKLSGKFSEYLKDIKETENLYVKVWIGKYKVPFCFMVSKNDDRIQVTTRVYHPKDLSSRTILPLLQEKINTKITSLNIMRNRILYLSNRII